MKLVVVFLLILVVGVNINIGGVDIDSDNILQGWIKRAALPPIKVTENRLNFCLMEPMQFPAGISLVLLVWLSCRVSYINNNTISG